MPFFHASKVYPIQFARPVEKVADYDTAETEFLAVYYWHTIARQCEESCSLYRRQPLENYKSTLEARENRSIWAPDREGYGCCRVW